MSNEDNFRQVFGWRRSSGKRRAERGIEDAVVAVILARAHTGGVATTALPGATRLAHGQVEAALETAHENLRIRQSKNGRWYPAEGLAPPGASAK